MPRLPLHHAAGSCRGSLMPKTIRLVRYGCTNRPFYHIVLAVTQREQHQEPLEQLGSYDPIANKYNEFLVALNLDRIQHWLMHGVGVSEPVAQLFGLAGIFPIHPRTYMFAWRNRRDGPKASENENSEPNKAAESVA
ncbi:mitochondrial ribosomal protein S16 [Nomia melanderi]|uniref:mitochondrial ribosomal protein S16 n=1 Tax=Nomia melanderi TaxID=2448451 RepID=UPI00130471D1|nr:probable 28S ribosomal protein S16, mitochondrial [Nomia melanderi]